MQDQATKIVAAFPMDENNLYDTAKLTQQFAQGGVTPTGL
jgi:hypothetical protein